MQKVGIDRRLQSRTQNCSARVEESIARAFLGAPGLVMLDLVSNALDRYAEPQKGAIDLVLEQSHALASLVKERAASTTNATEGAAAIVKQTVDRAVAAQKNALDYSVAQTKVAFETAKQQFGMTGTPAGAAAESFQRGVDGLIDAQ